MATSGPLLRLVHVSRRYESPGGASPISVLEDVSLEVERGETLAVVGPSGSGKSTLLHLIGTLDRPSRGELFLEQQNLAALNEEQLAAVRNRQIGFIFQSHFLLPQCTVLENVLVPTLAMPGGQARIAAGGKAESAGQRAERLLARVGLAGRLGHRPGQLSGGERQRVAVVRALIQQPQLVLADEPTGALDHESAQQLGQLLLELNREEGVTLLVATHALDLARKMGRVLELRERKLVQTSGESRARE